jgi:hypothetical protein
MVVVGDNRLFIWIPAHSEVELAVRYNISEA